MGRHGHLALKARSASAGTSPDYHPELEASKHLGVLNATGGLGDPNRGVSAHPGPWVSGHVCWGAPSPPNKLIVLKAGCITGVSTPLFTREHRTHPRWTACCPANPMASLVALVSPC